MRSVLLLVAGAMLGGAGVYLFRSQTAPPADAPVTALPAEQPRTLAIPDPGSEVARVGVDGEFAAARIAVYERALAATDALDLEAMLDVAAAGPRSRARDLEVRALLERLAELDPGRAVAYAQSSFLDTPYLVQAFAAFARADPDQAVAMLGSVRPAAKQRRVALGLLDVFGADEAGIERIASGMSEEDRASFELDALLVRAESDPFGVLRAALTGGLPGLRSYLLPRLAELAAARDPLAALAAGEEITAFDLAQTYEYAVLRAWAELDPDAVFAWLETADATALSGVTAAFIALAQSDPDRLLAMVDSLPPAARTSAQRAVLQTLAERDPTSALAMIETMPLGQDREAMLQTVAQSYGRQDPEGALAWARSLSPPSQTVTQAVLMGIATVDVDRAIDLLIADLGEQDAAPFGAPPSFTSFSFTMMMISLSSTGADVSRLTDKLLESSDPIVRSMLSSTLSSWASRDVDAALSWTLANAAQLDANAMRNIARNLAEQNLDLAVSSLEQLAPAQRAGWIEGMASVMAQSNVDQARSFLDRYRGQPGYEAAIGTVASELARTDPAGAARLLQDVGSAAAMQRSAFMIARQWANQDPVAAARWAIEDIPSSEVRSRALNQIASAWAQRDTEAAERWLFSLNSGPNRDAATDGLLSAAAQVGRFEPRLLDAYSSDQASQQGVSRAAVSMARMNPGRAEEIMDAYLTDPALRAQTEQQIAQMSAASSGSLSQSIFIGL